MKMNKLISWTFGSFFRTIGRIIAYVVIGFLIALLLSHGSIKMPKMSNILNDIFFMRVNASEISLSAKYDSTEYSPYTWSNSQTLQYGLFRYKEFTWATTGIAGQVYKEEINFNTNFNTNNYDLIEIPFIVSTSVVSWYVDNLDVEFPYCDQYQVSGNTYTCTQVDNYSNEYVADSLKINNNNISFLITYVGGGVTQCTYNNDVVVCPLTKNKAIKNITFFISTEETWYSIHDKFYLSISQYINFYKYADNTTDIINNQNANTNSIINNQNQNNQAVINNQNSNTNATIENQNQNTQETINSQKVCQFIDKSNKKQNGYLNNYDLVINSDFWVVTDYINIINSEIIVVKDLPNGSGGYLCFYNTNKEKISCIEDSTLQVNQKINIPSNSTYVRFSIFIGYGSDNRPTFNICQNGNQAMANTITDTNVSDANNSAGGFFNNFSTTDNGGLSSIITAPLSAIQSLTSATCSPLVLPLPFVNENLTLPCMRTIYESNFGGFMTLYDLITIGIISYWILVRIFNLVKDFKNPDHDEIEVVDL